MPWRQWRNGMRSLRISRLANDNAWVEGQQPLRIKEKGPKRWKQIAAQIPGKKPKQCRERWHNHLNPNIKKDSWSLQEEMVLFIINRDHGNRWKELTAILECRSDNNIKNHWNSIMKSKYQTIFDEIDRQFRSMCAKQEV